MARSFTLYSGYYKYQRPISCVVPDGCFGEFQGAFRNTFQQTKFTYQVRPGGRAFFQSLVEHAPSAEEWKTIKPTEWFRQQSWCRSIWEQDPSVAGALVMLDAIHEHFKNHPEASFHHLMGGDRITFQRLDLDAVGLHDDLYLRMNARGRPLTTFETFKARFNKLLETEFPDAGQLGQCTVKTAKDFADHIDTKWLDFIWDRYGPMESDSENTSSIDKAFIRLFRAVALVSLQPTREDKEKKITREDAAKMDSAYVQSLSTAEPDYDDFENGGWLTSKFTCHLIHVLEACESCQQHNSDPAKNFILYHSPWFGEGSLLDRIVGRESKPPFLTDFLQFAACVRFLTSHGPVLDEEHRAEFKEWNRVVRNLVLNSEVRADTFLDMLSGLDHLINGSKDQGIFSFLANAEGKLPGFNEVPTKEEQLKARLIQSDSTWLEWIEKAENHGYFQGQIGFLLDFSGASAGVDSSWTVGNHQACQERFKWYLDCAEVMFGPDGLKPLPDFLWERALLAVGDYFLSVGGNRWSFIENSPVSKLSWKRYLRDNKDQRRGYLRDLWDRLKVNAPDASLSAVIAGVDWAAQELWRQSLCATPAAWIYCVKRQIWLDERGSLEPRVFLLRGERRTTYTELYTFCFQTQRKAEAEGQPTILARFHPFDSNGDGYVPASYHPHLKIKFTYKDKTHVFQLYCHCHNDAGFSLRIPSQGLQEDLSTLLEKSGFVSESAPWWLGEHFVRRASSDAPLNGAAFLDSIAADLAKLLAPHSS